MIYCDTVQDVATVVFETKKRDECEKDIPMRALTLYDMWWPLYAGSPVKLKKERTLISEDGNESAYTGSSPDNSLEHSMDVKAGVYDS